jgi:prepilin-type processing-associated H-X9-DG protein
VLLALTLCCGRALAAPDPPLDGDPNLIRLVLDGQLANIAALRSTRGEIKYEFDRSSEGPRTPPFRAVGSVRQLWANGLVYWEYDYKTTVKGRKTQSGPKYERALFDGSEYVLYRPFEGTAIICPEGHLLTPNSPISDCKRHGTTDRHLQGVFTASSYHPGGVNSLWMDGSVRFVGDAIDTFVWRAVSTRAEGEQVDSSAF